MQNINDTIKKNSESVNSLMLLEQISTFEFETANLNGRKQLENVKDIFIDLY